MHPRLVALAGRQQGLLTRAQLGPVAIGTDWHHVQPDVLAPVVTVLTEAQEREAVRLSLETRAAATGVPWCFAGRTAAQILGLRVPPGRIVVAVQGSGCRKLRDVEVLTARALPKLRRVGGVPVPGVAVTIVQCAAQLSRDELITLVEHAVRQRRCTLEALRAVCGRGVSGSAALRSVIDELARDGHDRWVRHLLRLLAAAGLPRPETERGMPEMAPRVYLDLCWWVLRLVVEVDDWQTHASREAQERDRDRDHWLMRDYGAVVLRVTPRQLRDHPSGVVRDIVSAYRRAERRRDLAA
jgi:hypothetical protein